ncbi:unnamed protein product [Vitrella brassicaformis CCMP3155]|uniref:Uncharacterized protein n=1 Tax=Vitrella brassicaformis (strain CCMP3155) TaxID=1169540 RepID=A0A0G4GKZ1_VITBC|nr:unnamed protein product [Vitrella brassicaformis CCMP3155]|eukprot:CEM30691.1 unnamed protein product [Vitrella brassicaformis CCMP3155]
MSSGRPDTDMASPAMADGGDGDEEYAEQCGGGDERQPMDVEDHQQVSNVIVRQRNNAFMTEPSHMPPPDIKLTARVAGGPQASAASAAGEQEPSGSYTGIVKRAGFPLEREEHKRAKRDGQTHQLAANLPNGQQPQNPLAPHPAGGVGVPPQPPRVGGGVGVGVDRQQGSGEGRQDGRAPLPHGWKSLNEERHGADLNVEPGLYVAGSTSGDHFAYPLLSLCIDNLTDNSLPSIWAVKGDDHCPLAMPMWETRGIQLAIMGSLVQGGADINAGERACTPIVVAIASCNRAAFDLLMGQPGIQLRGRRVLTVPTTLDTDQPTGAHEATLLSFYRQLIERDSTLATERDADGLNPMHWAAMTPPIWSQQSIENYIDLLVTNGVDIRPVDNGGLTPLHRVAHWGSHRVAASLCGRLTAADIDRGLPNAPALTPLTAAAQSLDEATQRLQDNNTGQAEREALATIRIPHVKHTISVLLQAGADIAFIPTATERHRRRRQLMLPEYATVLNQLPHDVMATVNAALRPQREMADALTEALHNATAQQLKAAFPSFDPSRPSVPPPPLPPHVDPEPSWHNDYMPFANRDMSPIAWRVASSFVNPSVLEQSPRPVQNVTEIGRRVNTAMARFVGAAASLQVVGNEEVVGGTTNVDGERVRVPQLRCFVVRGQHGGQHRLMELREVVQRAILDEAARYDGLPASIGNGFTKDVAAFEWQHLGYVDERGEWVTLGM